MPYASTSLRTTCSALIEVLPPFFPSSPNKAQTSVVVRLAHLLAEAGYVVVRAAVLCNAAPRGILQVGGVEGPEKHVIGQQGQQASGHVGWCTVT